MARSEVQINLELYNKKVEIHPTSHNNLETVWWAKKRVQALGMIRAGRDISPMDRMGFWNVRGLNKVNKQKEMNLFMHNSNVGLFGLLETKIKRAKAHQASLNL